MSETDSLTPARGGLTPTRRLLRLIAPERADVGLVVLFSIAVGILTLATPIAVQALVNFVAFGGLTQPLVVLGILLFAFLALAGAIRAVKTYVVELLQRRIFVRITIDLAQRLPRVRLDAFDRSHGPELVNRFFDVLTVQKAGAALLLDGVGVALQGLVALLILAFYHPWLLAFDVVLILAILFILFVLGRGAVATAIGESRAKYAVAASLEEIARNPLTFKSQGGPGYALRRADELAEGYVRARRLHFRVVLRQVLGAVTLQAVAGTSLLTLGGWLVIQGELTLGQLIAAELIVATLLAAFAKFGKQLESFYDLLAAVEKLGQLLDLPLERAAPEAPSAEPAAVRGAARLALHGVRYRYADTRAALPAIDLAVDPGMRLVVRGGQGAGKSTLADIIYGVRAPSAGRVELDGVDYREAPPEVMRQRIALIRGFEMIEGSVEENVRVGRDFVTPEDVRAALAAVGLLDELRGLPDGLGTRLMSDGRPLSSGQARRLMVARGIAGRPGLIVVDELLDALDEAARAGVLRALLDRQRDWTVLVLTAAGDLSGRFDREVEIAASGPDAAPAAVLAGEGGS